MSVAQIAPNAELEIATGRTLGLGGLRAADGRAFPLQRIKVRGQLAGPCARTVVEQHFANPFDETLDVTWTFPLPADGALVELELRSGEIRVIGECQERKQAEAAFQAARREGKRAALVEKEQGDVHTLSLAGLPPRSEVTVRLTLVEMLSAGDGKFRWHFPTTIAPRYTPGVPIGHEGHGVHPDTDVVQNASRLTPPVRLEGGTELDLEVEIAGPLSSLESSLHAVRLQMANGMTRVAPSAKSTLNRDFVLEYSTADSSAPVTRAWTDGAHTLVLLEPPAEGSARGMPRDAVFAVDISGSMEGAKMQAAKTALLGALHGLRTGDRFKLLAFDDRVERFSDEFAIYDERNLQKADRWIGQLAARGGTEMLPAIQESLAGSTPSGRLRTVLLITDGQSTDENRLLPAVANRRGEAVFFTLGIDTAVNASLLKSLARAGGGVCELCTPFDDIDAVVARLETRFGSALLTDIKVAGAARPDGQTVFAGRPAGILLENAPDVVHVAGTGVNGAFNADVVPARIAFPLGSLWAIERVAWLEERLTLKPFEEEAIRPEILRIALEWRISSKFTSFVCVDHSTVTGGDRRHVVQPVEMPDAWELHESSVAYPSPPPFPAQSAMSTGSWAFHSLASPAQELEGDADHAYEQPPMPMRAHYMPLASSPNMQTPGSSSGGGASRIGDALESLFGRRQKKEAQKSSANARKAANEQESGIVAEDVVGVLARTQSANGSFGDDVERTAAALLVLMLSGNTRRKGNRRRTVQKAADWLSAHKNDDRVQLVLDALSQAEAFGVKADASWRSLVNNSTEGKMLKRLLESAGV